MGREEFAGSFESAFARLQVALLGACGGAEDWPSSVAAAIRAGLEFAADDPDAARTLTTAAMAHRVDGVDRYERLVSYLCERLAPGRELSPDAERLPSVVEHALASGTLMLVAQRIDQGKASELPDLAPDAIQFVLSPYLGAAEARRASKEV